MGLRKDCEEISLIVNLEPGTQFGHYRIASLLGRGGMGEVYEVEHTTLRRSFALKLLPLEFSSRPDALERFRREAQVMANLEHPNILRVDDFGDTDGRYWLRMELAQGLPGGKRVVSLQDYADALGGKIPQQDLLGILKQICAGLHYAHKRGAIHRDLKPSNILLSPSSTPNREPGTVNPTAKISDFGLVRLIGEEWVRSQAEISVKRSMSMGDRDTMAVGAKQEGTSTRSLLGTYEYMSPEQKRGEDADERSDLYALGLMTFRLLTGREPGTRPPSRIDSALAKPWDDLVADALEADPAERIANCASFLDLLRTVESDVADTEERRARREEKQAHREEEDRRKKIAADQVRKRREEEEAVRKAEEARRAREAADRERRQKQEAEERRAKSEGGQTRKRRGRRFAAIVVLLCLGAVAYFAVWLWKIQGPPRSQPSPSAPRPHMGTVRQTPTRSPVSFRSTDGANRPLFIAGLGMDFMSVEAGTFQMGSNDGASDEKPVHRVTFGKGFWMGKTEVTNGQYEQFLRESRYDGSRESDSDYLRHHKDWAKYASKDADYPIVCVSWHNAVAFCKWLTERERKAGRLLAGYVYRLPTEAEWEYAARGGKKSRGRKYSGSDNLGDVAWYSGNSGRHTQPVGRQQANELGLHDMSGNVWEWCADHWHGSYQGAPSDGSAWVSGGESSRRVLRGGSWGGAVSYCRVADRRWSSPSSASSSFGFRVVLGVEG